MPETVTLVLDAEQYYAGIARITQQTKSLENAGSRVGDGFLRGERAFRGASRNIAIGLLGVQDAASGALIVMEGLERVFKIGIGPTILAAGGIAAISKFREQIIRTREETEDLRKELKIAFALESGASPERLATEIETLSGKMQKLKKDTQSWTTVIMQFLERGAKAFSASAIDTSVGKGVADTTEAAKKLKETEEEISRIEGIRADRLLKIANLKQLETSEAKETVAIERAQLDLESERSGLLAEFISKGGNVLDFYKRLLAAQIELNVATIEGAKAREKFQQSFLRDVGSGKFAKDRAEEQTKQQQEDFARQQIKDFAGTDRSKLGPNAQAILDEAIREGLVEDPNKPVGPIPGGRTAGIGESQELVNQEERNRMAFENGEGGTDFANGSSRPNISKKTGLADGLDAQTFMGLSEQADAAAAALQPLGEMDFSGLSTLSGLTITIQ